MKVEVTHRGAHDAKEKPIPVGTIVNVPGDTIPGYLVSKCRIVGGKKSAVINPKDGGEVEAADAEDAAKAE